tara:strand:- start:5095 stop:5307 length:213 start_codon:yes stop_codon:yes gene_type:complete
MSTGQVARALGAVEPKVAELVRRGRITPPPPIVAGRRLWSLDQALEAARLLGVHDAEARERLNQGASDAR